MKIQVQYVDSYFPRCWTFSICYIFTGTAFNSPINAHCSGFGAKCAHKSCKQVCIWSLRNLIWESTPLKDTDAERDKTVIKLRASETISRQSSRERGETWPCRGDRARHQNEQMQRWRNRKIEGLLYLTGLEEKEGTTQNVINRSKWLLCMNTQVRHWKAISKFVMPFEKASVITWNSLCIILYVSSYYIYSHTYLTFIKLYLYIYIYL